MLPLKKISIYTVPMMVLLGACTKLDEKLGNRLLVHRPWPRWERRGLPSCLTMPMQHCRPLYKPGPDFFAAGKYLG